MLPHFQKPGAVQARGRKTGKHQGQSSAGHKGQRDPRKGSDLHLS